MPCCSSVGSGSVLTEFLCCIFFSCFLKIPGIFNASQKAAQCITRRRLSGDPWVELCHRNGRCSPPVSCLPLSVLLPVLACEVTNLQVSSSGQKARTLLLAVAFSAMGNSSHKKKPSRVFNCQGLAGRLAPPQSPLPRSGQPRSMTPREYWGQGRMELADAAFGLPVLQCGSASSPDR